MSDAGRDLQKDAECKHGLRSGCAYCLAKNKPTKTMREAVQKFVGDQDVYKVRLAPPDAVYDRAEAEEAPRAAPRRRAPDLRGAARQRPPP